MGVLITGKSTLLSRKFDLHRLTLHKSCGWLVKCDDGLVSDHIIIIDYPFRAARPIWLSRRTHLEPDQGVDPSNSVRSHAL